MKTRRILICIVMAAMLSCQTAEEEFVSGKLLSMCDEAYWLCEVPTGCIVDDDHYVEGVFPGVKRVVIETEENDVDVQVRLFLAESYGAGTELLVQMYETDCTLDTFLGRGHLEDVDIIDRAGDDRVLTFDLHAMQEGEHVLEIFSDMTAEYLLIAE